MTATSAPAAAAPSTSLDAALMRFPYETWIPMPDAARHVRSEGLPAHALTTVVRTGRRRGVLLVRREAGAAEVKRVLPQPHGRT
ncbi:hypothetical protein ACFCZR_24865 [Streptomyces rubiginosohelvolus]|uniref:hypothetical protein n=1 Tax=Streptomyces rubiginosohelvolus TaxID=67362 RepID=UPI0035D95E1D